MVAAESTCNQNLHFDSVWSLISPITVNVITQCNYTVTAIIGWTVMCEQWVLSGALVPNVHSQCSWSIAVLHRSAC